MNAREFGEATSAALADLMLEAGTRCAVRLTGTHRGAITLACVRESDQRHCDVLLGRLATRDQSAIEVARLARTKALAEFNRFDARCAL